MLRPYFRTLPPLAAVFIAAASSRRGEPGERGTIAGGQKADLL